MEEQKQTYNPEKEFRISKLGVWQSLTGLLAVLLVVSVFTGGFGYDTTSNPTAAAVKNAPPKANVPTGNADNNYFKGNENAPVIIEEYSDFQCPFCERFYTQTLSLIEQNFIATGKAKLIYNDFPLTQIHPMAAPAANAARCAGDQGQFWEYHNKIFDNQDQLSIPNLKKWGADIGLDTATFNSCIDNEDHMGDVLADQQEGSAKGVSGTPAFLINGQLISGAQPYTVFESAINAALNS